MPNYRRAFRPGGTFFFTLVIYDRLPIFSDAGARMLLRRALRDCQTQRPFQIDAMVPLPDHLHVIWTLPNTDADFSSRWGIIKKTFTADWIAHGGAERPVSESRRRNRRRGVWQRRFWEHVIRDADDLEKHVNYIHYNPVKHRLATCPHKWPWSSFEQWVQRGVYETNWCCSCSGVTTTAPDFDGLEETAME